MKIAPSIVKDKFEKAVKEIGSMKEFFIRNPRKNFTRERKLPFETVLTMMVKFSGQSLQNEVSSTYRPPDSNKKKVETPTKAAFIEQRNKIRPEAGYALLRAFVDSLPFQKKFDGIYRLLACDGSDVPIPRNEKEADFSVKTRADRKSYNLLHINGLFDIMNRTFIDCIIEPGMHSHERKALAVMASHLPSSEKAIILADRGYEGYNCLAHLIECGVLFAIRAKDIDSNGFLHTLSFPEMDEFDITVSKKLTFRIPKDREDDDQYVKVYKNHFDFLASSSDCYDISFRIVRFKLSDGSYECIATNLPPEEFPPERLKRLYHLRWTIENAYRDLKYTVDLLHFHGKSADAVILEIYTSMVMFNYSAYIAVHGDPLNHSDKTKYRYKVNFANAVHACREFLYDRIDESELLRRLKLAPVPIRDGRTAPRPSRMKEQSSREFNYRRS